MLEQATESLPERLWAKIRIRKPDQCWPWKAALSQKRNGKRPNIRLGRRGSPTVNPQIILCFWTHGPKPSPVHEAGHTCPDGENEKCCNPSHLRWMTRVENEHHKRTYADTDA